MNIRRRIEGQFKRTIKQEPLREESMEVIIIEPGKLMEIKRIENNLSALQKIVGGPIETLTMENVVFIVNEEGKLRNLPKTVRVNGSVLHGTVIVCSYKGDDFISLSSKGLTEMFKSIKRAEDSVPFEGEGA